MATHSFWLDQEIESFPTVTSALRVDVLIIGGGITGITAAYLLKKAGRRVALIDREPLATRDTGHTSAHVTHVTDTRLNELVKTFGKNHAQAAWDAGLAAMSQIEANVTAEQIECELRRIPGYLHLPPNSSDRSQLQTLEDDAALANEFGFDATELGEVPLMAQPGVRFANQLKFHPRKYLAALLRQIPGDGSHVFERSESTHFHKDPLAVEVNGHRVSCDYVVIATHAPLQGLNSTIDAALLQTKLAPYTTYAIGAKLPPNTLPEALFWDTNDPYGYLRVERYEECDYAIYGGEDHKTGQVVNTDEVFARLEKNFRKICPDIQPDRYWSGQVMETNDGLPYIGEEVEGKQFVSTGYSGNGMTFGTIGGMMARDAVLGVANPWRDLFAINRRKLSTAWDYLKENKDYPFYMIKDRLGRAEAESLDAVPMGCGKILKIDGKKVAAYRDREGAIHKCSAICTHMGCIVRWNTAEETWDCPCHGSRFHPTGEVMAGPAETPLAAAE